MSAAQALWTRDGLPYGRREGDDLWTYDGRHIGRFFDDEIYAASGWYLGEVRLGRLVSADMKRLQRRAPFELEPVRAPIGAPDRYPLLDAERGYEEFLGPV